MGCQASAAGERATNCARCGAEIRPGVPLDAAGLVAMLEQALLAARHLLGASTDAPHRCPGAVRRDGPALLPLTLGAPPGASPENPGCQPPREPARGLSRREAEVLHFLAAGHSNRRIATVLCLSPRTVQRHVANVYLKIGAHNRAEATAYALHHALDHGLR